MSVQRHVIGDLARIGLNFKKVLIKITNKISPGGFPVCEAYEIYVKYMIILKYM